MKKKKITGKKSNKTTDCFNRHMGSADRHTWSAILAFQLFVQFWTFFWYVVEHFLSLKLYLNVFLMYYFDRVYSKLTIFKTFNTNFLKIIIVWGISCTSYLFVLGSQACTVLFLSDMSFLLKFDPFLGSLWILSHIGKKCAPRMPYKLLGKGLLLWRPFLPFCLRPRVALVIDFDSKLRVPYRRKTSLLAAL